jgi:hypothetical protein
VIIYELVCLRRPFPASSIGQLAMAISINEPEALPESTLGDDIRQLVRLSTLLPSYPAWAAGRAARNTELSLPDLILLVPDLCLTLCLCPPAML